MENLGILRTMLLTGSGILIVLVVWGLLRRHGQQVQAHLVRMTMSLEQQAATLRTQNATLQALTQRLHELEIHEEAIQTGQRQVLEERLLLRALIDALPDLIYIKDTQHRFLLVNAALVEHVGRTSAEELIGKSDFDLFDAELAQRYYQDEQTILDTEIPLLERIEPGINLKTGARRWFLSTKVPFYDHQGRVKGLLGIGRDITKQKAAEDALYDLNKGLEQRLQRHVEATE